MIYLELAMLAIGIAAVVFSYRLVKEENTVPVSSSEDREAILKELKDAIEELKEKAQRVSEDMEDKMAQMSNEKIMGINEYSDQVLEKIDKTHEEVVFLYNMMNEKQDEMKALIHDADSQKAQLRDESVVQYQKMKEQEKILDEMKKEVEVEFLKFQSERGKFREELEHLTEEYSDLPLRQETTPVEEKTVSTEDTMQDDVVVIPVADDMESEETVLAEFPESADSENAYQGAEEEIWPVESEEEVSSEAASVFDDEIARIEENERKEQDNSETLEEPRQIFSSGYVPLSEQEQPENHNDEIVSLYKKGRSILEISKMLSLGQGEVKFVIDLYNATM